MSNWKIKLIWEKFRSRSTSKWRLTLGIWKINTIKSKEEFLYLTLNRIAVSEDLKKRLDAANDEIESLKSMKGDLEARIAMFSSEIERLNVMVKNKNE